MASQEEINFLQQRGKTLYRSAKYTEALDAFAKVGLRSLNYQRAHIYYL